MGCAWTPAAVYRERDIGKRTCLNCREHTPELHRSVPLPAPRRVALSGARVGSAYIARSPDVSCISPSVERGSGYAEWSIPCVVASRCIRRSGRRVSARGMGRDTSRRRSGSVVPRRARCSPCWRGSWHRTVRSWPWKVPGVYWPLSFPNTHITREKHRFGSPVSPHPVSCTRLWGSRLSPWSLATRRARSCLGRCRPRGVRPVDVLMAVESLECRIRLSHRKLPPSATTAINVAMLRSMAGTTRCNTQPTPSPIAIHTPVLTNAMIRNRSRAYTSLSSSRGQPRIMVMKPPHFRPSDYSPGFRGLDSSGVWAIHSSARWVRNRW